MKSSQSTQYETRFGVFPADLQNIVNVKKILNKALVTVVKFKCTASPASNAHYARNGTSKTAITPTLFLSSSLPFDTQPISSIKYWSPVSMGTVFA